MKVFTCTPGRTGTGYLAECFKCNAPANWVVRHEGPFYGGFGTFRPELSVMHAYNTSGNTDIVRDFWRTKLKNLPEYYVETSHINCKGGLIENLGFIEDDVVIIHLKRNIRDTFKSLVARGDLAGKGNMWLWYLDPEYAGNHFDPGYFDSGQLGTIAWYLVEMEARAKKLKTLGNAQWIEINLEEISTSGGLRNFLDLFGLPCKTLPEKTNANPDLSFDPALLMAIENLSAEVENCIRST